MDDLWDDYLQYLIWYCGLEHETKYERLFSILHHMEFVYFIDRDDNREADGIGLRNGYVINDEDLEYRDEFLNHWCSVLEVLIALAICVEGEIIGDPADEHPELFFMEMIGNLGLDKFKGDRYREDDVINIVDRWLNREFEPDGHGSPFPVKYDYQDQRHLEMWDQMNSYISENYG